MIHPRVLHVVTNRAYALQLASGQGPKDHYYIYAGRGRCPVTHVVEDLGNPFTFEEHGKESARLFLDWLRDDTRGREVVAFVLSLSPAREPIDPTFRGYVGAVWEFGCWCSGRYPFCHAEVYARLQDGETLEAIRADVLHRLELDVRQVRLFPGDA